MKFVILLTILPLICGLSEPGVWQDVLLNKDQHYALFKKIMYKDTKISVLIHCTDQSKAIKVGWLLRYSPCASEYFISKDEFREKLLDIYYRHPDVQLIQDLKYKHLSFIRNNISGNGRLEMTFKCSDHIVIPDESNKQPQIVELYYPNIGEDSDLEVVTVQTAENEKYQCVIPESQASKDALRKANYQGATPDELMEKLFQQNACSYRIESYWTYELCHGRHIRQYHENKEMGLQKSKLQEYYLGKVKDGKKKYTETNEEKQEPVEKEEPVKEEATKEEATKEATESAEEKTPKPIPVMKIDGLELPYYSVNMTDGSICDLNSKPRRSHVMYICQPDGRGEVYSTKETSSCEYEIIVLTSVLCSHPEFKPKDPPVSEIKCHSVGKSPWRPRHLQKLETEVLPKSTIDHNDVVKTWADGNFGFFLKVEGDDLMDKDFEVKVTVRMHGKYGYISAHEWPLLIFYGVMRLIYLFLGITWLVMLACNWRDLLLVQFWVGGVIVLGMVEKAVFYAEYQSVANNGCSVTHGAVIFAEVVSSLRRALARMLVIIVSIGFGIVKPRLGPTLHKVLFVGGLYFILGSIEGSMRALQPIGDRTTESMLAAVPLAVLDASICWWIFSCLIQTTRQLRLRRNIIILTLYRRFTNTLIFAVLASVIFMIWSLIQVKMKKCLTDWQELWVDEAFWHLLFAVILIVIMILWRPSSNNQRYAFSPLLDAADDEGEEDETVMNDAFEGMKMRSKVQANGSPKAKERIFVVEGMKMRSKVQEDDLKWVEDNIPSSVTDK